MIYLHVPFCGSFCTYCDFYSEICRKGEDESLWEAYVDGICKEISSRRAEIRATQAVNTLYIGGGTPSVLPLSAISRMVSRMDCPPFEEFTMEVNPEDIVGKGADYVRALLELGVNRVSMGVQSLDDGILRWMNRRHDAAHALKAFGILREAGVKNISVDVIFGISLLDNDVLNATLDGIIGLRPEHISAYQLGIEEGSALMKMVEDGRYAEASDEQCREQYELICRRLREASYIHYEISNWALPGYEAKHNSAYWTRAPYVGLGPAAHSFDGVSRSWNSQSLSGWTSESELLNDDEVREERIMLGLRTAAGVPEELPDAAAVSRLVGEGLLVACGENLRIPEEHFFISDDIISQVI